jgi:trk system potassium uptake protein TrkH
MMNFGLIANLVGAVLLIISAFMLLPVGVSAIYGSSDLNALALSTAITLAVGSVLYFTFRRRKKEYLRHREVFFVVSITWISVIFFGSLPYMLSGSMDSITNAFFEAVAGFTTTGATVFTDIEALPEGILFWRSLSQWLGGMGIILFALAVLPFVGAGGMQLFKAEVPELRVEKLRPRIIDTAKALWYIYASLTAAAFLLYLAGGMEVFDAVCHAFTTLAIGGFSTKNASIGHFQSSYIDGVCTAFMFLAGVNYSLYFYGFRGDVLRFWRSSEFRLYFTTILGAVLLVTLNNLGGYPNIWESLRYSSFQAVSIMTTTGYTTADYEVWAPFSQMLLLFSMFFGGMIGSTAGGIKQVRVLLMLKQGYREMYQLIHPRAVTSIKLDGKHITKEILGSIWGFLVIFILICVVGSLCMTALGVDMITACSTVISTTCNVGPAMGEAGPTDGYNNLPAAGKWVLMFCMIAGRLEIFTFVILFVPRYWKR